VLARARHHHHPIRHGRLFFVVVLCTGVIRCLYEGLEAVRRLSSALHSAANSQQPTSPPTAATHHRPSRETQHSTAQHYSRYAANRHSKRVAKGIPSCPCLEIAFAPPDPRLCCSTVPKILSCFPAGCALCFVISHPQPATPACFRSPRQFPGRLVPLRSISYSAPRLHFPPFTILSCD
jgi:hypothetical protein